MFIQQMSFNLKVIVFISFGRFILINASKCK